MTEEKKNIPACIGIIMDGNRRWAKGKGLPTLEGHRRGYEKLKEVVSWGREAGVKNLAVYAFSTENWKRSEEEVSYLLDIFRVLLREGVKDIARTGIRIRFAGNRTDFNRDLQESMKKVEEETAGNSEGTLWVAFSYGGRAEILSAFKKISENKTKKEIAEFEEKDLSDYLWTAEMPDPDIIIRTGGEKRLSNFLPWQSVYSELYFLDTFWPDFSKEQFSEILENFSNRERRMGK